MATRERRHGREEQVTSAFKASLEEGRQRLGRTWPGLLATGFVGGVDVGIGVLALLVVEAETGSRLLGALAFSIGFIALTLARSELFTENFLVPVMTVVAKQSTVMDLLRLWLGTLGTNLVGGWLFTALVVGALPRTHDTAVKVAEFYPALGIGWHSFSLGVIGGVAITVMTWMERSSGEIGGLVAAVATGFLLAAAPLNHVIVVSLEMFAALHVGAPFGYLDWLEAAGWSALANLLGGLGFVTVFRLIQVGGRDISDERARS